MDQETISKPVTNVQRRRSLHEKESRSSPMRKVDDSAKRLSQDTTEEFTDSQDENEEYVSGIQESLVHEEPLPQEAFDSTDVSITNNATIPQTKHCSGNKAGLPLFLVSLIFVMLSIAYIGSNSETPSELECSFNDLQKAYPEQNEYLWKSLTIGIKRILYKRTHSPGIYLLVHNGESRLRTLIKKIGTKSASCFGSSSKLIEMTAEDFQNGEIKQDYGVTIEIFREKIKSGKVALIANLNEIPPDAARAFHTICDTVTPIAEDVVVFLTLKVPSEFDATIEVVHNVLYDLWGSKLAYNELDPLITRVTDHVLFLKN